MYADGWKRGPGDVVHLSTCNMDWGGGWSSHGCGGPVMQSLKD